MIPHHYQLAQIVTRRHFFGRSAAGIGTAALASLLDASASARDVSDMTRRGALAELDHRPRTRRVVYIAQAGGPPQMELYDYKPTLAGRHGQELPETVRSAKANTQLSRRRSGSLGGVNPVRG